MLTEAQTDIPQRPQLTVQTRQSSQQTVFARLQGLFHDSPSGAPASSIPNDSESNEKLARSIPAQNLPKFLKIRLLTWNMHDSVPKGDLEELFGKVPFYTPPSTAPTSIPQFPADTNHPYHLIVVAGQECPTTSVLPAGLGAGFKLYEKEKDKDKDKDKDKEDRDKEDKPRSSKHSHRDDTLKSKKSHDDLHDSPPSGWTSMIEDWLCHGGYATRAFSPSTSDISIPKPLSPRLQPKEPKKGPYQLLCKERLLGIYLAIYIHRDLRPFVQGTSKSSVTAGLLGGRWGNKGGVGISANIDGKTFLFINCHLAAQIEKANLNDRLNNYNKIKAELAVDDFLKGDDPRVMAEDLTDKFDYTFVFGDLNFRLDISRLHADWLISRQDYAQALAFDQLRNLMLNGRAFVGFHEAPIDFPPTFKYDVLRTLKGSKRRRWKAERAQRLTEVSEKELADAAEAEDCDKSSDEGEGEGEAEVASVASSIWTSTHSRHPTDRDEDGYFRAPAMSRSPSSKLSISVAAQKAKTKWMALLSPTAVPASPTRWLRSRSSLVEGLGPRNHKSNRSVEALSEVKNQAESSEGSPDPSEAPLRPPPPLGRVSSTKSSAHSDEDDEEGKAVYDTSSKKRVPSWCDRILWKSTVEPDPDPEIDDYDTYSRPRTRVGQFFANAFRPLTSRSRRESMASISTSAASSATPIPSNDSPLPSPDLLESIIPFSRFVYPESRPQGSQSMEHLAVVDKPSLPRIETIEPDADTHDPSSTPSDTIDRRKRPRSSSGAPHTLALDTIPHTIPGGSQRDHTQTSTPSKWRFLPSFLTHTSSGSTSSEVSASVTSGLPRLPRKGDVVCLSYRALDDKEMRRLEGRSDHRPVIGSYAVYI